MTDTHEREHEKVVQSKGAGRRIWYSPRSIANSISIRPRVYLAALIGAALLVLLPGDLPMSIRAASAWCLGGAIYLAAAVWTMRTCGAEVIEARAARQDDSKTLILFVILLAIAASFAAIAGLLAEAKSAAPHARLTFVLLAAMTISISWGVTQFVFALHYAHEFYLPEDAASDARYGLEFPGCDTPDYWDFLYFATSIGATSQTSDVSIRSRALRRLVTLHAVVSFVFNTMVLALTVNLAASLAS